MNNQQQANFPSIDEKELYRLAARLKALPEPGFFEFETKKVLQEFLANIGAGAEHAESA
jgi:metal-dependent amidase/aminoacylase/carboxypeptidase family protein